MSAKHSVTSSQYNIFSSMYYVDCRTFIYVYRWFRPFVRSNCAEAKTVQIILMKQHKMRAKYFNSVCSMGSHSAIC